MTETRTEFATRVGITIRHRQVTENPNITDGWCGLEEPDHWFVKLTRTERGSAGGQRHRTFTCVYTKGAGHHGAKPTIDELLCCLTADAAGCLDYDGFEEWAEEWDMNPDSRKAEQTYKHALQQSRRFKKFINSHWHELLHCEEK